MRILSGNTEEKIGPIPHDQPVGPLLKSLSHFCRKYRRFGRFCRLCRFVSAVPSITCDSALSWHGRGRRFDPDQVHQIPQQFRQGRRSPAGNLRHGLCHNPPFWCCWREFHRSPVRFLAPARSVPSVWPGRLSSLLFLGAAGIVDRISNCKYSQRQHLVTMNRAEKSPGIKELAKALHVSIGTVDRALHGRAGISEKTRVRVLKMARELGYQPNLAARALKLNRTLSIAAVLPRHISHFFDPVREGIRAAAAATVRVGATLEFHEYPRVGVGDLEALESAARKKYDGIIFLPGDTRSFDRIINRITQAGTAVMCVGSDAPNSARIGSVAAHAAVSGGIAAELLSISLNGRATVAVITGELSTLDHAEKLRGFAATLAVQSPHIGLLPVLESHERPKEAYRLARTLMLQKPRPDGLYLSTANSLPVLQALRELDLLGKVKVVATDLFQELVPLIESGSVLATLYQRPFAQGKLAFETLLQYLVEGAVTRSAIRLAPHILFRSNIALFSSQIANNDDEVEMELL
ncbi:MAG: LacI family DNA-binding transcriptional regulator [Acidobacteriaceae bacterium]